MTKTSVDINKYPGVNRIFISVHRTVIFSITISMIIILLLGFKFGFGTYYNMLDEKISGWQNPTYAEMNNFVMNDNTDKISYKSNQVCDWISKDLIKSARNNVYRAGYVYLSGVDYNHAIVCFETSDMGLYFVDPQVDIIFSKAQLDDMLELGLYDLHGVGKYVRFTLEDYSINWFKTTSHQEILFWSN